MKIVEIYLDASPIAKNFQCGEKKAAYVSVFGIAPYFQNKLKTYITDHFMLFFSMKALTKKRRTSS